MPEISGQMAALLGALIGGSAGIGGSLIAGQYQLRIERFRLTMEWVNKLYEGAASFEDWGRRVHGSDTRDVSQGIAHRREHSELGARLVMVAFLYVPRVLPYAQRLVEAGTALERAVTRVEVAEKRNSDEVESRIDALSVEGKAFFKAYGEFHSALGGVAHRLMGERKPWRSRLRKLRDRMIRGPKAPVS